MRLTEIDDVIATRKLILHYPNGQRGEAVIEIGRPKRFPDSPDYYVPFRINGLGHARVRYAGGVDAVHALQNVMTVIAAELLPLREAFQGRVAWDGDDGGGLGFPAP